MWPCRPIVSRTMGSGTTAERRRRMIGRQAAVSGMMMIGARLLTRVIDLATMLVLARLLDPTDFGLVALATSAVVIIESALDLPLNQALVRLKVVSRAHYDTAFTLAALRVALLTSIILLAAWPFAWFYDDKRLFWLVCARALGAGARGLTSPCLAEYQKAMSFWRDFVIQLGAKTLAFAVGCGTALMTHSYWSIAVCSTAYPLVAIVGSYCFAPYRPRFSLAEMPAFREFVGWMSAAQVLDAFNWQSERLLLGKLQDRAALGLFSTASDITLMPIMGLFGPTIQPLLAAFSLIRDDKARLARSYQYVSDAIVAFGLPVLVGECLIADPAIRLVLGPTWLGAIPVVRWLSLSLIPALFGLPAVPLVMSVGKTKIFLKRNAIELGVKLPALLVGGIAFGFAGIAVARGVAEAVAAVYCVHAVRRLTGLSIGAQLLGPWRSFVATLVMAAAVAVGLRCLDPGYGASPSGLAATLNLMALIGVGAATYLGAAGLLWLLTGRPPGIEAMAGDALIAMVSKARRLA
jgi:O-antigen/teichoic acid export membrane protein